MAEQTKKKHEKSTYNYPFLNLDADSATKTPVDTEIVGSIPEWLEGSLYRNGAGIYKVGDTKLRHLFDGFAILHRFHLHCGKVTYTSRVLDTDAWERSVKANRLVTTQFGTFATTDPCKSIFGRAMSYFKPRDTETTDNVAVNVVEHSDRLYAMTETPYMVRVNPETLLKDGTEDLRQKIAVHLSTAHPHFDTQGNMYNLGTAFNPPHNYNIIKFPPAASPDAEDVSGAQLLVSLQSRWMFTIGYNHSFGMSRDYFVIPEQPVTMSSFKFLTNNWRKAAHLENYNKHPNEEMILRVVRRSDNKETNIKYRAEPSFTFHFVNCYEEEGYLVVDFVGYSDLDILENLYVDRLDSQGVVGSRPLFRRYVLPLSLDKATEGKNLVLLSNTTATAVLRRDGTVFLEHDDIVEGGLLMELPRMNYDFNATKYRYAYGTQLFHPPYQLVKLDLYQRKVMTWQDEDYMPGEPVFVSRPGATEEDDGVILSPVLGSREDQRCYLVVLDASTFQELGRAYTPTGVKMALTFHGSYVQPKADKK